MPSWNIYIFLEPDSVRIGGIPKCGIDRGATSRLLFRALNPPDPILTPKNDSPCSPGGETILFVEDESTLREIVSSILSSHNYRVLTAGSGPEAIEVWEQHKSEIALLFTDIVMPFGLSGVDLGSRFHEEKPSLKTIYTSGHQPAIISRGAKMKENGIFISKPYVPSDLIRIIRKVLND